MNSFARNLRYFGIAMIAAVFGIAAVSALGQAPDKEKHKAEKADYKDKSRSFCENNNWSNSDKVSVSDLREMTVASTGSIRVDAGKNGGVTVKGEDRSDVLVRACVQAWGATEEAARAAASAVKIGTGSEIKADGPSSGSDQQWSVSYQILVPRATNTNLKAHNGGISISNVEGNSEFETLNGGINVSGLAGNVKGRTMNGGVNVSLAGNSWQGSGLDLQTTNGGVKISMPATYAATVETGTVNGGYRSDIPALNVTTENLKGDEHYRSRAKRVQTALNGGGAPIKVMTTNGGVMISTINQ